MSRFPGLKDFNAHSKRVLMRVDINAPFVNGEITDDTRLRLIAPGVQMLVASGAKVILCAHFGRPNGKIVPEMSLRPLVKPLMKALGKPVAFCSAPLGEEAKRAVAAMNNGDVLLLENIRFIEGEEKNSPDTARALAELADVYVNDGFSVSHRAHASTEGVARLLPAYAGPTMLQELEALQAALGAPKRPLAAVVGGSKVSTKITLLKNLVEKADLLVIGGGMANTFLAAQGYNVGASLYEKDFLDTAKQIMKRADACGVQILLPVDVVTAKEFKAGADYRVCAPGEVASDEMILDAGPKTVALLKDAFAAARTVIWNGPLGAFETEPFHQSTVAAAKIVADLTKNAGVVSVAGGGDTVSALNLAGVSEDFTYVSGAGGAFLEWMEGKVLPGVAILEEKETVAA